jgi:hypothetical protein
MRMAGMIGETYYPRVTRYYGIPEANAVLPEVERILILLRDQREELVGLRDRAVALGAGDETPVSGKDRAALKLVRLRMQGLVDQMQAGVARLVELDVTLRDIPSGLIDFPALVDGAPVWLCWRLGEDAVSHWHRHDEGFSLRRPIDELPTRPGSGRLA